MTCSSHCMISVETLLLAGYCLPKSEMQKGKKLLEGSLAREKSTRSPGSSQATPCHHNFASYRRTLERMVRQLMSRNPNLALVALHMWAPDYSIAQVPQKFFSGTALTPCQMRSKHLMSSLRRATTLFKVMHGINAFIDGRFCLEVANFEDCQECLSSLNHVSFGALHHLNKLILYGAAPFLTLCAHKMTFLFAGQPRMYSSC